MGLTFTKVILNNDFCQTICILRTHIYFYSENRSALASKLIVIGESDKIEVTETCFYLCCHALV